MADLHIMNSEDHLLAPELVRTDKSMTVARVMEIAARIASRPVLDPRSPEEILGYDENGLSS